MTPSELKQNFHALIDSIDNLSMLQNFYDLIKSKSKSVDGELWNGLSLEDQNELLLAFSESENDSELIDNDDAKLRFKKWL
jgi:hypothetical protein